MEICNFVFSHLLQRFSVVCKGGRERKRGKERERKGGVNRPYLGSTVVPEFESVVQSARQNVLAVGRELDKRDWRVFVIWTRGSEERTRRQRNTSDVQTQTKKDIFGRRNDGNKF